MFLKYAFHINAIDQVYTIFKINKNMYNKELYNEKKLEHI
jgi:hypothetical protein